MGKIMRDGVEFSGNTSVIYRNGIPYISQGVPDYKIIPKTITLNGIYDPTQDNCDGYSNIAVAVPTEDPAVLVTKTVTAPGVYNASADNADGYSQVTVNTPDMTQVTLSAASQMMSGIKAYNGSGTLLTGNIVNRGAWTGTGTPSGNNQTNVTIPAGYHNGSGYITCKGQTAYTAGYNAGKASKVTIWTSSSDRGSGNITIGLGNYSGYAIQINFNNPSTSLVFQSSMGARIQLANVSSSLGSQYIRDVYAYKSGSNLIIELGRATRMSDGWENSSMVIPVAVYAYNNFTI